jgi:hypothetical protein
MVPGIHRRAIPNGAANLTSFDNAGWGGVMAGDDDGGSIWLRIADRLGFKPPGSEAKDAQAPWIEQIAPSTGAPI